MNKKFLIGLFAIFFIAIGVLAAEVSAAPSMPYTIIGTLSGDNIVDVEITIEDTSSLDMCRGKQTIVKTNNEGKFVYTLNNLCSVLWEGHPFKIILEDNEINYVLSEGITNIGINLDESTYKSAGGKSYKPPVAITTTTTIPKEDPVIITTTTTVKPAVIVDPTEKDNILMELLIGLIVVAAVILSKKYTWGKGFIGLVKYWAKKNPKIAIKMIKTAIEKEKAGKYKGD